MSLTIPNFGGTLTGGADQALAYMGSPVPGKVSFVTSEHTRLAARQVDFTSSQTRTTTQDPGTARSGLKVTFSDRLIEEGCCTVQAGSVIIDLGVRWSLNQPESLADAAIAEVRALVFSPAFTALVKTGALPSA